MTENTPAQFQEITLEPITTEERAEMGTPTTGATLREGDPGVSQLKRQLRDHCLALWGKEPLVWGNELGVAGILLEDGTQVLLDEDELAGEDSERRHQVSDLVLKLAGPPAVRVIL